MLGISLVLSPRRCTCSPHLFFQPAPNRLLSQDILEQFAFFLCYKAITSQMMQQGWYPQQNKGISSSTQTQRTPQTRALGMGEKFCSQKKQTVPPPWGPQDCHTRHPPCRVSLFHLIMFVTAHTLILGRANPEHCYPNEPCMSPPSQPAWQTTLGFYLPLFHLPFRFCRRHSSSHVAQTQEHPPCLCTALHFGQRGCKNMCQSQRCWP